MISMHADVPCKNPLYHMLTIQLFVILLQQIAISKIIYKIIFFDFPAYIFLNHLPNNAYEWIMYTALGIMFIFMQICRLDTFITLYLSTSYIKLL